MGSGGIRKAILGDRGGTGLLLRQQLRVRIGGIRSARKVSQRTLLAAQDLAQTLNPV